MMNLSAYKTKQNKIKQKYHNVEERYILKVDISQNMMMMLIPYINNDTSSVSSWSL